MQRNWVKLLVIKTVKAKPHAIKILITWYSLLMDSALSTSFLITRINLIRDN